jgi:nucleotide-binding universal stress UspA family protein
MAPTRVMIERILCPTDFSDFSRRALRKAVTLASWFEARVTALHVVLREPLILPGDAYGAYIPATTDLIRARQEEDAKELSRFIEPFLGEGVPIETSLIEGDPSREIAAAAAAMPADLVVMGTHGRSGFERLLLGSVTEKLLRIAPCPVLTVGNPQTPAPDPLFHRILCATDLTKASAATLDMALSMAEENLAPVTLLHVVEGLLGETGPEIYRPVPDVTQFRKALVDQARERLHEAGHAQESFCKVNERVETGTAWREILRVAGETSADLIVVGTHAHGAFGQLFLGSTANQVVRHAVCPVLVVREMQHRSGSADQPTPEVALAGRSGPSSL